MPELPEVETCRRALAPLVKLTSVSLYNTAVTGNISALAPLVQLRTMYLPYTAVTGDVQGLAPLVQLIRGDVSWSNAYALVISIGLLLTGAAFVAKAISTLRPADIRPRTRQASR